MVYGQPYSVVSAWVLSFGILMLGVLSHHMLEEGYNDEISVVRFFGVTIGLVGFIGLPISIALDPYITDVTYLEAAVIQLIAVVLGWTIGHYGWKWLGPNEI